MPMNSPDSITEYMVKPRVEWGKTIQRGLVDESPERDQCLIHNYKKFSRARISHHSQRWRFSSWS